MKLVILFLLCAVLVEISECIAYHEVGDLHFYKVTKTDASRALIGLTGPYYIMHYDDKLIYKSYCTVKKDKKCTPDNIKIDKPYPTPPENDWRAWLNAAEHFLNFDDINVLVEYNPKLVPFKTVEKKLSGSKDTL